MTTLLPVVLAGTGLPASSLGLGTVELGLPYGLGKAAPPDDAACIRLLHHAQARGIAYLDTAAAYGRSEEIIGQAFPGGRERPVIATKVSLLDPDGTAWSSSRMASEIQMSIDRSRTLLRTEVLDLVQIHNAEALIAGDQALHDAMNEQIQAGNVRHWGASTYGEDAAMAVLDRGPLLRTLQIAYSLLDRTLESQVVPACHQTDTGLILRSVFLQGVLSDRRHTLPDALASLRLAADTAARVAEDLGVSLPVVALRFALFESTAQIALVGTADKAELDTSIDAAVAGPLPHEAVKALRAIKVADETLLNPGSWPT